MSTLPHLDTSDTVHSFPCRLTRPRGNWALTYNDAQTGQRHRHHLKTRHRREAEKLMPAVFDRLMRLQNGIIDTLVEACLRDNKAGRVIASYLPGIWRRLSRYLGGRMATSVTIGDCRAYVALRRSEGVKGSSIRTELLDLRIVLNWAKKHGYRGSLY